MPRIAISQAAFKAIAATLPRGSVAYEAELTANGGQFIWLDRWMLLGVGQARAAAT
jgi:hypothetical protein